VASLQLHGVGFDGITRICWNWFYLAAVTVVAVLYRRVYFFTFRQSHRKLLAARLPLCCQLSLVWSSLVVRVHVYTTLKLARGTGHRWLVTYLCFVLFASFTLGMPPTRFLECTVHPLDILDQYVCLVGVIMLPVKHHPGTMGFGNCLPLPSMSGFLVYESHSVPVIGWNENFSQGVAVGYQDDLASLTSSLHLVSTGSAVDCLYLLSCDVLRSLCWVIGVLIGQVSKYSEPRWLITSVQCHQAGGEMSITLIWGEVTRAWVKCSSKWCQDNTEKSFHAPYPSLSWIVTRWYLGIHLLL